MYKKKRKTHFGSPHIDVKHEIACFHVEPANAKMAGKIVVTWSFLPIALHVYEMLNLSYKI